MKCKIPICLIVFSLFLEQAALAGAPQIFALIITNNRSYSKTRPDLQYADDDGARYYSFFNMVAKEENISLLAKFDEPTSRLYPDLTLKTLQPNRSEFEKAVQRMKGLVNKAKQQHQQTVFYFIFAGHGYVEGSKGFLELEDGRIGPDDLEKKVLEQVKADVVHIVLDSCDSFFVINPRKPGGKRWATPKDLTEGFSKRYPHVGVVLSTNSAAEVYEWSEISSGIFSHEIRSGLSGAADADGDGKVSYDEIEAFVATANLGIKNESYLPKVFVRGPWNKGSVSLLDLRSAKGRKLKLGKAERRLWIRDELGVRLIDLRKEKGSEINLVLPGDKDKSLYIQEQTKSESGRYVLNQYVTPKETALTETTSGFLTFDELQREQINVSSRGHDEVFQMVFAYPYGIKAFNEYIQHRPEEHEVVFGISESDKLRMRHYLSALARSDRQKRIIWGGFSTAFGLAFGVSGGLSLAEKEKSLDEYLFGAFSLTGSAVFLGVGIYQLFSRSRGETTYENFEKQAAGRSDRQAESIVAKTEVYLEEIAKRERTKRFVTASLMYFVGATSITMGIFFAAHHDLGWEDPEAKVTFSTLSCTLGLTAIGFGITRHFIDTPVERMLRLYREDPDLHFSVALTPVPAGGAAGFSLIF